MIVSDLIQGSSDWHLFRSIRCGASDTPSLMGCGYLTPLALYNQKKGLAEGYVNDAMRRGSEMEAVARAWYECETGNRVMPCVMVHPTYDLIHASFDGLDFAHSYAVEIKCPGANTLKDIERYGIPESWFCQCQHQMFVANLDAMDLYVYDGIRGKIYPQVRDEPYILKMLTKILEFLECLKTNTPPVSDDVVVREDEAWKDKVRWYEHLIEKRDELDGMIEEAKQDLIKEASGRNTKGCGLSVTEVTREGIIDYKAIPQLKEIDLEQYRKPSSSYWRVIPNKKPLQ